VFLANTSTWGSCKWGVESKKKGSGKYSGDMMFHSFLDNKYHLPPIHEALTSTS
jgi:hypothetical protein